MSDRGLSIFDDDPEDDLLDEADDLEELGTADPRTPIPTATNAGDAGSPDRSCSARCSAAPLRSPWPPSALRPSRA